MHKLLELRIMEDPIRIGEILPDYSVCGFRRELIKS